MKRALLLALFLATLLCPPTQAQTIKCTAPDGKVTYSNVACPDSTQSVKPVDTSANTLDGSALRDQAQKDKATVSHVEATQREHAAAEAASRQQAQAQAATAAKQEAQKAQGDEAAYANCTRDVERQAVTEDVKAELFAACRTAGASQRQSGMTDAALRECVRSVERTGAYARERARQVAVAMVQTYSVIRPLWSCAPRCGPWGRRASLAAVATGAQTTRGSVTSSSKVTAWYVTTAKPANWRWATPCDAPEFATLFIAPQAHSARATARFLPKPLHQSPVSNGITNANQPPIR